MSHLVCIMSENWKLPIFCLIKPNVASPNNFFWQSKNERASVYRHIRQVKAEKPHMWEAGIISVLAFLQQNDLND